MLVRVWGFHRHLVALRLAQALLFPRREQVRIHEFPLLFTLDGEQNTLLLSYPCAYLEGRLPETRVLVARYARLSARWHSPLHILALTFAHTAASEILELVGASGAEDMRLC